MIVPVAPSRKADRFKGIPSLSILFIIIFAICMLVGAFLVFTERRPSLEIFIGPFLLFSVIIFVWAVCRHEASILLTSVHFKDGYLEVRNGKGKLLRKVAYADIKAISHQTVNLYWTGDRGFQDTSTERMIFLYINGATCIDDVLPEIDTYEKRGDTFYHIKALIKCERCEAVAYSDEVWQWILDNISGPVFYCTDRPIQKYYPAEKTGLSEP